MPPPRPPTSVQVGARKYRVEISDQSTKALDCLGATLGQYSLIVLSPCQDFQSLRETFVHELTHAVIYDTDGGNSEWLDEVTEEKVCRFISGRLVDLLLRNPRLVTYLTHKG